jgi:hypothetical protein
MEKWPSKLDNLALDPNLGKEAMLNKPNDTN